MHPVWNTHFDVYTKDPKQQKRSHEGMLSCCPLTESHDIQTSIFEDCCGNHHQSFKTHCQWPTTLGANWMMKKKSSQPQLPEKWIYIPGHICRGRNKSSTYIHVHSFWAPTQDYLYIYIYRWSRFHVFVSISYFWQTEPMKKHHLHAELACKTQS